MPGSKIAGAFDVPAQFFSGPSKPQSVYKQWVLSQCLTLYRVLASSSSLESLDPRSYVNAEITTSFSILSFLFVRDMVGVNDEVQGETAYNGSHNRKKDGS